jgi:hypothetical protein
MSEEHPNSPLTLSTVNLSADGARVMPDGGKANVPVTEAAALAALQSLAGLPAVNLANAEAKIYLAGPRGKVAVQNQGGKLFVTPVPESVNTAAESRPEEIIARLMAGDSAFAASAAVAAVARDAEVIAEAARPSAGWRRRLGSGWVAGTLAVVVVIAAYFNFAPDTPEGVSIIRDSARVAGLHAGFNGRYGASNATVLVLNQGRLTGHEPAAANRAESLLFEKSYQFGLRAEQVVLVVDNGALLEPQSDGSLKFMESSYPRQAR